CTLLLSPTCRLAFNQPSTKEIMSTLPFLICLSPHLSSNHTRPTLRQFPGGAQARLQVS
ncbi:hypothetical protein PLICRDRAFT_42696, partial [Plicaturopsis crispa FD-325 SS-3]